MPTGMVFSAELEELRRSVRRLCDSRSPSAEVRRLMETPEGYSPAVWLEMASQLGLQGLGIPQCYGGAGFGFVELAIVLEEMGRTLFCAPYFATVGMAANALLTSGDEGACAAYLPGVAAGKTIATLALAEDSGGWDEGSVTLTAQPSGSSWALDGHKSFVLDGSIAHLVLVA